MEYRKPTADAVRSFYSPFLDLFKDRLVAIHCKDYILSEENGTKIGNLPALTGVFDWSAFMSEVKKRDINVLWSLENMNPTTVVDTVNKLQDMWEKA